MRRTQTDEDESERAVSPVIGVILMVAITVILAAVIATLVMDFGSGTNPQPNAAFDVEQDGNDSTVELISVDRLDSWDAACNGRPTTIDEPADVGSTMSVSSCSAENVTIVGEYDGSEAVLG